jgi:hypothetical protein
MVNFFRMLSTRAQAWLFSMIGPFPWTGRSGRCRRRIVPDATAHAKTDLINGRQAIYPLGLASSSFWVTWVLGGVMRT